MKQSTGLSVCLLVIALLQSCSGSGQKPPVTSGNGVILNPVLQKDLKCPNGTLLDYENFGEAFLLANCTHCHSRDLTDVQRVGAPDDINLDRPSDVAQWRSLILKVAAAGGNNKMPPSGHTSSEDRSRLAEWLNCGGPANADRIQGAKD